MGDREKKVIPYHAIQIVFKEPKKESIKTELIQLGGPI